jgi:hypothetical protein
VCQAPCALSTALSCALHCTCKGSPPSRSAHHEPPSSIIAFLRRPTSTLREREREREEEKEVEERRRERREKEVEEGGKDDEGGWNDERVGEKVRLECGRARGREYMEVVLLNHND